MKASITSCCGEILKIDSTEKLAGDAAGTCSWATNVGNEFGEVLSCVLTTGEGQWLRPMAEGLVKRYKDAGVPPPVVLYTDRDCCEGRSIVARLFPEWPRTKVRLDVWHFMRRIASCCTTEAHLLYGEFLGRLSTCIFEWDDGDLQRLRDAKKSQMEEVGLTNKSNEAIMRTLQKKNWRCIVVAKLEELKQPPNC